MVIVMDVDTDNLDDAVDAIVVSILPPSLRRFSHPETFVGLFGYGLLTVRYRVDCDDNFFGEGLVKLVCVCVGGGSLFSP